MENAAGTNALEVARQLRLLAQQAYDHAIVLFDLGGIITWWSAGAERIFGMSSAAAVGSHAALLFPGPKGRDFALQELAVAKSGARAEDDRFLARGDGSTFWATGAMFGLQENGQLVGYGKIIRNRDDLNEQLETLRNQIAALQARDRRKDAFLSTLSHELRNPLSPMSNAAQLLAIERALSPEGAEAVRILDRQIGGLRRLVDDLLDLSRAGAGKIDLKKERFAIQELLAQAASDLRSAVEARRHQLELLAPATPIVVCADRDRLRQVFINLLQNAVKYTPEGGRIWVKATTEGNEGVVHIEDTGLGIPHDMLPHIFELFTQVDSTRRESKGGLGIGLSVVKQLVMLHNGSVQVESDGPGKGSIFTVRLPLDIPDPRG